MALVDLPHLHLQQDAMTAQNLVCMAIRSHHWHRTDSAIDQHKALLENVSMLKNHKLQPDWKKEMMQSRTPCSFMDARQDQCQKNAGFRRCLIDMQASSSFHTKCMTECMVLLGVCGK